MTSRFLSTEKAPAAVGPYSQGVKAENIIFTSGQLPIDPATGELSKGDIQKETRLCLENVKAVLEAAHGSIEHLVKVTVFVTDINDFSKINEVYAEFFGDHKPARSLIQVAALPKGADIEIEGIAVI
ncbi:RidA family protein [Tissierella praeacuta]|uniref:2-iminobutanoate/2-iminopropanoate deaminase n=1 Tax=Tissierella praeacuta DSM 18095 TaxID=1123404 RepID=A0A1M4S7H2_9FIRM|nr:RidA family protein [Tissierella praeacuta]HAE92361.1 RidA family protein [Tissierella sp.]MBU5256761.1 RidA family protein [Tissierella praeacuta]TCU71672.1 2-iminobutanoate/2-iminopropanoate deaminase [Tissierella praeacuta]SHE27977.1 2-iminobutanoate/2-iminopropanoate deaminase [Tissierella praeacuta DSM 18095]SUP01022.1 Putative reactive intermediate deaminase TdcF [Tissierella praeacuta]